MLATGAAKSKRAGRSAASTVSAARAVPPVASPSSTRITERPLTGAGGRPPRKSASRRFASASSRFVTSLMYESLTRSTRTSVSSSTRVPSAAIAPIPSSSCPGAPSLRATNTSSGAPRARAIGAATGTPPRGIASTVTGSLASAGTASSSSRARSRPASDRFRKSIGLSVRAGQMPREPVHREATHCGQGAFLLEEVRRIRHDRKLLLAAEALERLLVERDDRHIGAAHDEQRGRAHIGKAAHCEIGTAAARHHRVDVLPLGGGRERGRSPGTRAEIRERKHLHLGDRSHESARGEHTLGQRRDVEAELACALVQGTLLGGEQICAERGEAGAVQNARRVAVPRAAVVAPAAVCEHHHPLGRRGDREEPAQRVLARGEGDLSLIHI